MSARIIDRGRGPELEGTRITVYAVMDHVRAGDPPEVIRDALLLTPEQVDVAIEYIHTHWNEVNREYDRILKRVQQGNPEWVEELLARTREELQERLRLKREGLAHADRAG